MFSEKMLWQFQNFALGLDLIGNPVRLMANFEMGAKDLVMMSHKVITFFLKDIVLSHTPIHNLCCVVCHNVTICSLHNRELWKVKWALGLLWASKAFWDTL